MGRKPRRDSKTIRLGFVPLADCAPLLVARALGLFAARGLQVELRREIGWATIRDKVLYGELEGAHAPAGILFAATSGLGCVQVECLTGIVMNLHGNAITLSQRLWREGVRDGETFRQYIKDSAEPPTLGVVNLYASHTILLHTWLRANRIDPQCEVRIVVVPPAQVFGNLKAGNLDGYCVGEPWNSEAVLTKTGWCPATSVELAPGHVEKVLMVTREFARRREIEHLHLIAALAEACRFCDEPQNREMVIQLLAEPSHVGASLESLRMSLGGRFDYGNGRVKLLPDFHVFSSNGANEPTHERARWLIRQFHRLGIADSMALPISRAEECFRPDLYAAAVALPAVVAGCSAG